MKRAQGLPISTIIIAALGLIVLIVLGVVFSGQIEKFGRAANACSGRCYKATIPTEATAFIRTLYGGPCNLEFEAEYKGATVPAGLPKVDDPGKYRCDSCCIPTG